MTGKNIKPQIPLPCRGGESPHEGRACYLAKYGGIQTVHPAYAGKEKQMSGSIDNIGHSAEYRQLAEIMSWYYYLCNADPGWAAGLEEYLRRHHGLYPRSQWAWENEVRAFKEEWEARQ